MVTNPIEEIQAIKIFHTKLPYTFILCTVGVPQAMKEITPSALNDHEWPFCEKILQNIFYSFFFLRETPSFVPGFPEVTVTSNLIKE